MKRIPRLAAAAVIVATMAGLALWLTVGHGGATVAWADVQEIVRNAQTMTWNMHVSMKMPMPGGKTMDMIMDSRCFFKEPGMMRQEVSVSTNGKQSDVISIVDYSTDGGRMVTLMPAEKKAMTAELDKLPEEVRKKEANSNYGDRIKKLVEGSNEPLGEKEIDGRPAKGYHAANMGVEMDIWVDAETALPLLIEGEMPGFGTTTMTDFAFDVELDDALFDLSIPEGYKEETFPMDLGNITEDDLLDGLRLLASYNGNEFPPAPTMTPEIMKAMMEDAMKLAKEAKERFEAEGLDVDSLDPERKELLKKELMAASPGTKIMRMTMFLSTREGKDFQYVGKGVQLGDAGSAVCWYQSADPEVYRVVYGDLSIRDVAAEDLPAKPQ